MEPKRNQEIKTQHAVQPGAGEKAGYRASVLDHFFDAVRAASIPTWLVYLGLWLLLWLLFGGAAAVDGLQPAIMIPLVAADEALYIVYYLALMHYLDGTAGRALSQFHPLLGAGDAELARLRYELTTLPARSTAAAAGSGVAITLVSLRFAPGNAVLAGVISRPSTQIAFLLGNAILAVFVYHTIRQLWIVSRIHNSVTQIDLYRRGPIYAFSQLTTRTALGWILGLSLGLTPRIAPLLATENLVVLWLLQLPPAVLLFALPLVGVHRLQVREKARLQDDVAQRLQSVLQRLHGQQDSGSLGGVGETKTLLDGLLVERDLVAKLPTWPWRPGALAGFASALLLPLAIWLLQRLLTNWLPG